MYTIAKSATHRFIEVKIVGMCSIEEFRSFVRDLNEAIEIFPHEIRPPGTLYDFTRAAIQSQEVVQAMKALAENPAMTHRRVAMYTEGVLARLQATRICASRDNMSVFPTRVEAIKWLESC